MSYIDYLRSSSIPAFGLAGIQLVNNKSQGSVAVNLRCGGLFRITSLSIFAKFCSKKILKSVKTWQNYRQKGLLSHVPCLPCEVLRTDTELAR